MLTFITFVRCDVHESNILFYIFVSATFRYLEGGYY